MRVSSIARAGRRFLLTLAALLLAGAGLFGQDVTEPALKAAFVYNLAKFTEWPADVLPANAPLVACVLGETPVGPALERTVRGRLLSGRTVSVATVTTDTAFKPCHVLYVSGVSRERGAQIAESLSGKPVLTIVDIDGTTSVRSIARLFVENGKMRFDLDLGLARRSRLQLSSKMLTLASRVHDDTPGAIR